jgi:hypothetical protein
MRQQASGMADRIEPAAIALVATCSAGMSIVHAVAILAGADLAVPGLGAAATLTLTLAAVAIAFAVSQVVFASGRALTSAGMGLTIAGTAFVLARHGAAAAAALAVVGTAQTVCARLLGRRLEWYVSGMLRRRPVASIAWAATGVLLLVQVGRLSTFMADPSSDWWLTTRNELWARHMCMPAYIQAADLQRRGVENVYAEEYYPALVRTANPQTTVRGMVPFIGDPYQYPPQFLLLPRLALRFTNDFLAMRTVWYAIQVLGMLAVALLLARWVAGASGLNPAWLIPVLWLSVPVTQSLQYGQFHLSAIALAVGGMLAFERRRDALGGALLAAAALAKIFPGILVVYLLMQRRWRQAAWTCGFAALFTLIAFLAMGAAPFTAFLTYQLPRLSNGQAFDFARDWPELRLPLMVVDNLSPTGLLAKLGELGAPGMTPWLGEQVRRGFAVLLLALALVAARRRLPPREQAIVWLGLLNLGALQGFAAWGDYITLGSVWLLTLAAAGRPSSSLGATAAAIFWIVCLVVPGAQPIPAFFLPVTLTLLLASIATVVIVGLNACAVAAPERLVSMAGQR